MATIIAAMLESPRMLKTGPEIEGSSSEHEVCETEQRARAEVHHPSVPAKRAARNVSQRNSPLLEEPRHSSAIDSATRRLDRAMTLSALVLIDPMGGSEIGGLVWVRGGAREIDRVAALKESLAPLSACASPLRLHHDRSGRSGTSRRCDV